MRLDAQMLDYLENYFVSRKNHSSIAGDIIPDEDLGSNLGNASRRFDSVYTRTIIADNMVAASGSTDMVDGFHAYATPQPDALLALDGSSEFPNSVYPNALLRDGTRSLTGNLAVDSGITIDGVDISSFKSAYDSHVSAYTTHLTADSHIQYVHISTNRTITAQHSFSPGSAQAPFLLGANAQDQLVIGLDADTVDGQHAADLGMSAHDIVGSYHTVTGAQWDIIGLTATNTLGLISNHPNYVHISNSRTITAQHSFSPGSAQAPFLLGANAQGQTVVGFKADQLNKSITAGDGLTGGGALTASREIDLATPGTLSVSSSNIATGNHTHAITSSANPGAAQSLLATDASGFVQLVGLGIGIVPTGAQPFRVAYDSNDYSWLSVASDGGLTIGTESSTTGGDIIFRPEGEDLYPYDNYAKNLGTMTKKWLTLHAAELWVETLVAQDTIATIGGRILIGPTTILEADSPTVTTQLFSNRNFEDGPGANKITNPGFETAGGGDPDIFADWTEVEATAGDIVDEGTITYEGSHSAKLIGGTSGDTYVWQNNTVVGSTRHTLSFWTRGDGTNAGRYRVRDVTHAADIIAVVTTGVIAATWTRFIVSFNTPSGCTNARVYFYAPSGSTQYAYFDQSYLTEADWDDWTETVGDGKIYNEAEDMHEGSSCVRLESGASANTYTYQDFSVTQNNRYGISFWTRGDGVQSGRYRVYDVSNTTDIIAITSTAVGGSTWTQKFIGFTAPSGCSTVRMYFYGPSVDSTYAYFDKTKANDGEFQVKHNQMAVGDIVYMEADGSVEFMGVGEGPSGTGPYTYTMARNLDGTGTNSWVKGDAMFNTGAKGDGFIDLYSVSSIKGSSQWGPTIVGNVRQTTSFNDWDEHWAIGNLDGLYNNTSDRYGVAFGDPDGAFIQIDATDGYRIFDGTTVVGQWSAGGDFTLGAVASGKPNIFYDYSTGDLNIRDNTTVIGKWKGGGDFILGQVVTDKPNMFYDLSVGRLNFRGGTDGAEVMAYLDTSGAFVAGGGDVVLDVDGLTLATGGSGSSRIDWQDTGYVVGTIGVSQPGSGEYYMSFHLEEEAQYINEFYFEAHSSSLSGNPQTIFRISNDIEAIYTNQDFRYEGDLRPFRNSTFNTGYIFVPLTSKLTSTSFDGDSFSTTSKTLIDLSSSFGAPAGIKAVLMAITVRDSGSYANDCYLVLSPNNTDGDGVLADCSGQVDDSWERQTLIVPCDSSGDIYYQIAASSTTTFQVYMQVWGYWI